MPFFSLIIPTYNRADFIRDTIESSLRQQFNDFEIIVVDDGSIDATEMEVKKITDVRVKYYKKKNEERGAARNFGIQQAQGSYVTFLDSDDLLYPNHFSEAHNIITKNKAEVCALSYHLKQPGGKIIRTIHLPSIVNKTLLKGNILSCIGVFIKKEIALQFPFETNRQFAGTEDWALWLKLSARYTIYGSIVQTSCMLDHENRSVKNFKEDALVFRANFLHSLLTSDEYFLHVYGKKQADNILAHMYSYASLHLAMSNKNTRAYKWLFKALTLNYKELFTKRVLAINNIILKNTLNLR